MVDWQDIPAAATWVHHLGANVLFVAHDEGQKRPLHRWAEYQHKRQTTRDFDDDLAYSTQRHGAAPPAFGVISGPNGWHAVDFDKSQAAPMLEFLELAGLPAAYPWVSRSGSGKGYGVFFLSYDDPEPALPVGCPWYDPRPDRADFDHFELRWARGQTVLPESLHPSGNRYQWLHTPPSEAPAVLSWDAIRAAVEHLGEMRITRSANTPRGSTYTGPRLSAIDEIKARLPMVDIARRVFRGDVVREGEETRIVGHGGLHVNVGKGVFNSMRDGEAGVCGDVIDLVGMSTFGISQWDRRNRVMFATALEAAAREAGIELDGQR